MSSGTLREKMLTMADHKDRIKAHNSNEPSCPPQTAEIRYTNGNWELELEAT